jgi:hypothetical protein
MFVSIIVLGFESQYPRINIMLYPFLWFLNYFQILFIQILATRKNCRK